MTMMMMVMYNSTLTLFCKHHLAFINTILQTPPLTLFFFDIVAIISGDDDDSDDNSDDGDDGTEATRLSWW